MLKFYLKSESGVFAVMAAVAIPTYMLLQGAVMMTGSAVIQKNNAQNAADLAVISANATYRHNAQQGSKENIAKNSAKEVGLRVNNYNLGNYNSSSNTTTSFKKQGDIFEIQNTDIVESINKSLIKDINYTITANTKDEFKTTTGIVNQQIDQSAEVAFAYDVSYSMSLPVSNASGTNSGPASESLKQAAHTALDVLFDPLSDEEKRQFAYSQVMYHKIPGFRTLNSGSLSNKERSQEQFNRFYDVKPTNRSTNIRIAVHEAAKLIDKFDPTVKKPNHNEVMVLMSDGVPTATFFEGSISKRRVCTGKTKRVKSSNPNACIIDGITNKQQCKLNTVCVNDEYEDVIVDTTGQEIKTDWFLIEDVETYQEFLDYEKPRILGTCDDFKKSTGTGKRFIFSVFFNTSNEYIDYGKQLMKACATQHKNGEAPFFYFAQNSTELVEAYAIIAARIKNLSVEEVKKEYLKLRIVK